MSFAQYVLKLKSGITFIDNNVAKEQFICQHCIEQFRSEFKTLFKEKKLNKIIEEVSQLDKAELCINCLSLSAAVNGEAILSY